MLRSLLPFAPIALAAFAVACAAPGEATGDPAPEPNDPTPVLQRTTKPARVSFQAIDRKSGIPDDLLSGALAFFDGNQEKLQNRRFLTVVDFSRHSSQERFFVVNLETGAVEAHVVAHGSGSDPNDTGFAQAFSNEPGSNASSDGFYVTGEVYDSDKNGRSMRLDGVSPTNSNARDRLIVVHGAEYVAEGRPRQGRSNGCPALPAAVKDAIISEIAGGSLLFLAKSSIVPGQ